MKNARTTPQMDSVKRLRSQRSADAIIAQYILDARTPVNHTAEDASAPFQAESHSGTLAPA